MKFGTVNKLNKTTIQRERTYPPRRRLVTDACLQTVLVLVTGVCVANWRPNLLNAGEYKTPFHFARSFVLDKICGQLPHHGISNSSALKTGAQSNKVLYVSIGLACLISPMISTSFLRLSTVYNWLWLLVALSRRQELLVEYPSIPDSTSERRPK